MLHIKQKQNTDKWTERQNLTPKDHARSYDVAILPLQLSNNCQAIN